jgi:ribosomal protein L37E
MDETRKQKIIKVLEEKGAILPCTRCGHNSFQLVDSYASIQMQDSMRNIVIGGKQIPVVVVGCNRCGNLSFHALGVLGLLGDSDE